MNRFKISKLLSYLLAPFMMFAVDDDAGGAAQPTAEELLAKEEAAAIERGDIIVDPAAAKAAPAGKVDDPLAKEPTAEEKAAADAAKAEADAAAAKAAAEANMTPEEKAAAQTASAEAEEAKAKAKDTRMPLSRHEAILAKERERSATLQAQLEAVQRGQAKAVVNDDIAKNEVTLASLEAEYNELITNGDAKAATAKMAEIRRLDNQIGTQRMELAATTAERNAVERMRFDSAITKMESTYPVLDPDKVDVYDQAKVDEVLRLMNAFQAGDPTMSKSTALHDAVKYVMGEPKAAAADVQEESADDKTKKAAQVEADRKAEAIKRNLAAANAQPATLNDVGKNSEDSGKLTAERVAAMSQKEFDKLGEAERAKLRGDVIA